MILAPIQHAARAAAIALLAVLAFTPALIACSPKGQEQAQVQPSGAAEIGGPFRLIDQDGRAVDQSLLNGKWTAVFFGYTYCPDVCPTTLTVLGQTQAELGPKAKALQVLFVSVDPDRDTPAQLKTYLSSPVFPKGTLGLTGAPAQVAQAAKAYRVIYLKEGTGSAYSVTHSSAIYLMDPKGRFDRALEANMTPQEMAQQIADAMSKGPKTGL
jgi:protein SCO1/2